MRLKWKEPELSLVEVKTVAVSSCVALTCAPETTAPWGSVTVPEIEPLSTCPKDGTHQTKTSKAASTIGTARSLRFDCICIPPYLSKCCTYADGPRVLLWTGTLHVCCRDGLFRIPAISLV